MFLNCCTFCFYSMCKMNHLYLVTWLHLSINLSLKKKKIWPLHPNTQFKLHSSLTEKLLSCQFWWLWLKYYLSRELPPVWCSDHSCIMLFMLIWQWLSMLLLLYLCSHLLFFFFPTICWQFLDQGLTFWLYWNKFQGPKYNPPTRSVNWTFLLLSLTSRQ